MNKNWYMHMKYVTMCTCTCTKVDKIKKIYIGTDTSIYSYEQYVLTRHGLLFDRMSYDTR